MKIYSYVVKHDNGFAPNPFYGFCTLACCKPKIRKSAEEGDWVVGTGSVNNIGNDKIIYAMKITEKLTFEQYSHDERFIPKIPGVGKIEIRGDNIYYKDKDGQLVQRRSYHKEKDKLRDLSTDAVLISDYYFYFGKKGILIPENFRAIVKNGPGHKCNFNPSFVIDFTNWLESNFSKGLQGNPSAP
jgi:hypothetical protein